MIKVKAQAPTRVDLAGGTLDLWPIHCVLDRCATLNVAVDLPAEVEVQECSRFELVSKDQNLIDCGNFKQASSSSKLPLLASAISAVWKPDLPAIKLTTSARSPAGAGLGGSSCLLVTILGALAQMRQNYEPGYSLSEGNLVDIAQNIEARLIYAPTGCQDYWGAVRGGINAISYPVSGADVHTYKPSQIPELNEHLLMCYSGQSRASAINNWQIFKKIFDRDQKLIEQLNTLGELAADCLEAMVNRDFKVLMALSEQEWNARLRLWPKIETDKTRVLDRTAKDNGALYTRVCGAGGGGVMAVLCPPKKQSQVISALEQMGGEFLGSGVAEHGLRVW